MMRKNTQEEFSQIYPQPGWVEHDADEICTVTMKVISDALRNGAVASDDIEAIGITNQRETVVVWDRKTGKPVHRAIVWQDRRTARYCDELKARGLLFLDSRTTSHSVAMSAEA